MKFKLKNIKLIMICLLACSSIPSCKLFVKEKQVIPEKTNLLRTEFTAATVINHTVDGCSWMIKLEDGKLLEPVNLKDEFKKENLKVWIQYKHYDNFSFCMAGEMVTITAIEVR
jgi:hypothetical protein